MGDYFKHWLEMGEKIKNQPKIFNVNWFRTDSSGNFLWPGYGDNLRVLEWIIGRCKGSIDASRTPIGFVPYEKDIDTDGLDLKPGNLTSLLEIDNEQWLKEAEEIRQFYSKFESKFPVELNFELENLINRLKAN
jgi:phosphoenolpyruvate carboxykinase (GTP)